MYMYMNEREKRESRGSKCIDMIQTCKYGVQEINIIYKQQLSVKTCIYSCMYLYKKILNSLTFNFKMQYNC